MFVLQMFDCVVMVKNPDISKRYLCFPSSFLGNGLSRLLITVYSGCCQCTKGADTLDYTLTLLQSLKVGGV